jgi:hypothetical protein
MTEKVLFEFCAIQTESGCRYKIRRGKRAFTLRGPKGSPRGRRGFVKANPAAKRKIRRTLETLEDLYDELYPPG